MNSAETSDGIVVARPNVVGAEPFRHNIGRRDRMGGTSQIYLNRNPLPENYPSKGRKP